MRDRGPRRPLLPVVVGFLLLVAPTPAYTTQLNRVVVLTRHGVRSPLAASTSSPYAKDPWPSLAEWGVECPGNLTPRGGRLVEQMGRFYHAYYAEKGLLPQLGRCPARQMYIWSDNEERTLGTAHALAAGMSTGVPNCQIPVKSLPYTLPSPTVPNKCQKRNPTDYFFHPLSDPALKKRVDATRVVAAAASINQELPRLLATYHPSLQMMQDTLQCCDIHACKGSASCTLFDLPDQATAADGTLTWTGMFSVSSTAAENFLLEYGNGMPCNLSGWGRVAYDGPDCQGGQSFRKMEELHALYFNRMNHGGYMAEIQGSNLANQILQALARQSGATALMVYSGHDTNIASVSGLLGLNWSVPDLPDNDTPPGGALVFELWGVPPEAQSVRLYYMHQTLTQLRTLEPLSLKNPPNVVELTLPGCAQACPFAQFQKIVSRAILKEFTTAGPSSSGQ